MKSGVVIEAVLRSQGLAVFTYLGEGRFRRLGSFPKWFLEIGGAKAAPDGTLGLGKRFPFVQNFLSDAEEIWKAESRETKDSGVWIEKGIADREIAIEASAFWLLGIRLLVFRNPQAFYQDQRRWLQTARQSRLKHDRLGREIQKKEILLHCIIHDLSQPLSAMRGCFSCLKLESAPDAMHELVETGLRQSETQESMIREILDVFSEEIPIQAKVSEPPDIAASAADVVKDFSAAFGERGMRIELDQNLDLSSDWRVAGDEPRLRRIFANLVENCLRLSPSQSTVVLGVIDEDQFVRAFVDDEGPGFAGEPEATPEFSLFGRKRDHGGKAGLGLYFCRITVEQWGGTIGCEQRPEGGARFWFRLPRAQRGWGRIPAPVQRGAQKVPAGGHSESGTQPGGSWAAASTPAQQNDGPKRMEVSWRPLCVLVAEDTAVNAELTTLMLEYRGHAVVAVKNGREVLSALESKGFELILMDQEMPELNGVEATRAIRLDEQKTGKHVPIVGLTGIALMGGRDLCLAAGMDACLPKPFQVDELYKTIEGFFFAPDAIGLASRDLSPADRTPLSYLGSNRKFVRRLVGVFLADSSRKLSDMRRAISRRDPGQLANSAHALGGSASVFDAKRVAAASRRLEAMGRSADFNGIDAAYASLAHEFGLLRFHLRRLALQNGSPSRNTWRKRPIRSDRNRGKK